MLTNLTEPAPDKILALMAAFREDPRESKIDLGVGVYRDAAGTTPIMAAVRDAEQRLWHAETTKSYVALAGDKAFADAMIGLVLGDALPRERLAAAATPGGTGAVHLAFETARTAAPGLTAWLPDPSWPNHRTMLVHLGIPVRAYRYFDSATGGVDISGMCADIAHARPGDLVILHGCCHNPTGANPTATDWQRISRTLHEAGATAMVDLAYQGFGDGLEEDAAATRHLAATLPELMIAASCSKNFGLYRERAGLMIALSPDAATARTAQGVLAHLNRQNFSFPPDHGARLAQMILDDPDLRASWQSELEEMRTGMIGLREKLAAELRRLTNSDRFDFLARHRGMFSLLGCDAETVERLRANHGIYMVPDSRMNIAGLNAETVPILAGAIADELV